MTALPVPLTVSDEALQEAYGETLSVWKAGAVLGLSGQTVHQRLKALGVKMAGNGEQWTEADDLRLKDCYLAFRNAGRLKDLADSMGRTRHFICRQARALGLTNPAAAKAWLRTWKGMSLEVATVIWEDFRSSRLGLGAYCANKRYDKLGFWKTMRGHFHDEYDVVIEAKAPRQSKYRLGRAVEYSVRDLLRKKGFFVLRSPASKSPIDLVAIESGRTVLIQCKRGLACGVQEWNEFYDLAIQCGAVPVLAGRPTGTGIQMFKMTGRKDGSKRRQPMEPWEP